MKKLFALSLFTIFMFSLSIAQDISGQWYDVANPSATFQLNINKKSDSTFTATYDILSSYQNLVNVPIDTVIYRGDSLLLHYSLEGIRATFRGKHLKTTGTIAGHVKLTEQTPFPMILKREAIQRDYEISGEPEPTFTKQDTLRGSITPERAWWNLTYYHLDIRVHLSDSSIEGSNTIQYQVLEPNNVLQIDLREPLSITKIVQDSTELSYNREGYAYFVQLEKEQMPGDTNQLVVYYHGQPKEAVLPPWDGGFVWSQDSQGKPWIATTCQGEGASMWWPNKDHMYDEVDSMMISVNVPEGLTAVANGKLIQTDTLDDQTMTFHWFVSNPINNYGVNVNIADYAHFSETYQGEKGALSCDYYVLKENLEKAKEQFQQVPMMLEAFEHWFGPYPFYEDGYKLVGVPYLGMEHQSSVTYGNHYQNGYHGRDWTDTEWGKKFDFIIIHESGHEWFANNITYKDIADIWIHEGFTAYSEGLYVEYHYGKEAGAEYIIGSRKSITHDEALIGHYHVNDLDHTGDVYFKGSNILHTLRQWVNDDEKWRSMLRGLNEEFYHETVTTGQVEHYLAEQSGLELNAFFDQYLRTKMVPTLEYYFQDGKVIYRWINAIPEFDMPVRVTLNGTEKWIHPKTVWTQEYLSTSGEELKVDRDFYVGTFENGK